jgi:hypothetical protein
MKTEESINAALKVNSSEALSVMLITDTGMTISIIIKPIINTRKISETERKDVNLMAQYLKNSCGENFSPDRDKLNKPPVKNAFTRIATRNKIIIPEYKKDLML